MKCGQNAKCGANAVSARLMNPRGERMSFTLSHSMMQPDVLQWPLSSSSRGPCRRRRGPRCSLVPPPPDSLIPHENEKKWWAVRLAALSSPLLPRPPRPTRNAWLAGWPSQAAQLVRGVARPLGPPPHAAQGSGSSKYGYERFSTSGSVK